MDKLLRAFEAAWRSENPPQLADYLPADTSERQAILPELVLLDLEFRLKRGEAARVDAYLTGYPELTTNRQTVLELLVTEFELRKRLDSEVRAEDYLTRFPEYAADLPEHFHKVLAERSRDGAASTMRMPSPDLVRQDSPRLPGCEVLRELGRGGMGIVYLARQPALERLVAVKVLRSIARADQQECLCFMREIQAAARLRHPHIVPCGSACRSGLPDFFDCVADASRTVWFLIFFSKNTGHLKKSSNLWPIRVLVPDSTDGKGFGRRVGSLETFSG